MCAFIHLCLNSWIYTCMNIGARLFLMHELLWYHAISKSHNVSMSLSLVVLYVILIICFLCRPNDHGWSDKNLLFILFLQVVTSLADSSANIIFGAVVDDRYTGGIHVTIIATGFPQSFQKILLTDPKAAKIVDARENKGGALPNNTATNSSPVPSMPRRLFFWVFIHDNFHFAGKVI